MGNKFYILDNGYMEIDKNQMLAGATMGTVDNNNPPALWIQIPVYSILIDCPEKGWILFDTGCHPDGMKGRWSPMSLKVAPHYCTEDQLLVSQLRLLGLEPSDIKTVVLSHMHCDHAGGLFLFKDTADVYVNKDDLMRALIAVYASQDPNASGGTCRADVIEPVQKYCFLGNKDYEIAPGVELLYTPGHSAGLMALMVHLDAGTYIFPVDSVNLALNYGPPARLSTITVDSSAHLASIEKIRELELKYKAKVMFPHDMEQFKTFKLAPECYE
ncbi:MAG: N-acyl homoserine lactonase family protein [Oscillospiraceae bacterium]|jgi:glyoxylase-like metal-dependent hydrolase (beta-lactamase superfamily II)|nr:N-acyl homoserine lactonase family protein [Oscillospiraceae bacterium]